MEVLHLDAKQAFSLNLKRLRNDKKLTQVELCEKAGLTQAGLSQLESGINWPDHKTVALLAKALKCEQTDLFKLTKETK